MPFNSLSFLLFFVVLAVVYFYSPNKSKHVLLILGSWLFYTYTSPFNLLCLLLITGITYFFAIKIKKETNTKFYLSMGIILIGTQLVFLKYSSFFADQFSLNNKSQHDSLAYFFLPIGLSFYSLQAIALLVDIRNKKYQADLRFKDVSLFLSFFPQSISGPIHRANELLPQFDFHDKFKISNIVVGIKTALWGYFCKLIVADKIALLTTPVFNTYFEQDGLSILIASLLFSIQIYFDFWGYSLIAIGVGKILGFNINVNFNSPYTTASFREFWHRWHITLSKWMRDYIYIPLGGRQNKSYFRFCLSILITFLVSGFWHGITINFLLWGIIHTILYLVEDLIRRRFAKLITADNLTWINRCLRLSKVILFFVLLSFTWLVFRTDKPSELSELSTRIISVQDWSLENANKNYLSSINIFYLFVVLIAVFFSNSSFMKKKTGHVPTTTTEILTDSIFVCICISFIILLGDIGGREFLYFKF